jgi:hypothetical protein
MAGRVVKQGRLWGEGNRRASGVRGAGAHVCACRWCRRTLPRGSACVAQPRRHLGRSKGQVHCTRLAIAAPPLSAPCPLRGNGGLRWVPRPHLNAKHDVPTPICGRRGGQRGPFPAPLPYWHERPCAYPLPPQAAPSRPAPTARRCSMAACPIRWGRGMGEGGQVGGRT